MFEADITLLQSASHSPVATAPDVLGVNSQSVSSSPVAPVPSVFKADSTPVSSSTVANKLNSQPVSHSPVVPEAVNLVLTSQSMSSSPVDSVSDSMDHSSQNTSPAVAVSPILSPISPPVYTPDLSPITSSTKCTTPTSSLVDSYRLTSLVSPNTCIDTTQTHTTFTMASISSTFQSPPSTTSEVSQLSKSVTTLPSSPKNLKESNPSDVNVCRSTPGIASLSSQVQSVELWNRKSSSEKEASSDNCDFFVNPYGLQEVLSLMVRRIDNLCETSDSLRSQSNIMANSLHTALSEKIDRELMEFKEVSNNFDTFKSDLENKMKDVVADNEEMRGTIDRNMEGVRLRVRHILNEDSSLQSENDEESASVEPEPLPWVAKLNKLSDEINKLKDECYKLDCRVIETEQYPRRESLVFHGIPASIPHNELENTVFDILVNLGFEKLRMDDICRYHRLWSPPNSREPAPVIVKFMNSKLVEWSLQHSENLKIVKANMGMDLTMSESLCSKNAESLKICKWLKKEGKIHNHFTRNGFSKVVFHAGDRTVKISHPDMLKERFDVPSFNNT